MPLDTNKIAHIQSVVLKTFASRQKTVIFVYQNSGGSGYTYTATSVIFRPQEIIDPEIPNLSGAPPQPRFDMLMITPISTNLVGVVMIADTATANAGAVAAAQKYAIIEAVPTGIVAGGSHYQVKLRRFR
jgi:flavoprotein